MSFLKKGLISFFQPAEGISPQNELADCGLTLHLENLNLGTDAFIASKLY